MADIVFGVAKPLVFRTLNRAQLAIQEESNFRKKTQRDLVFITGEFQMMHYVLSATTEENFKSDFVSPLVTQVRDLAYDLEDGIEFVVHLDTKSDWLFRSIPRFMRPSLPLDEAVDIIEQLKARVQDVSQRIERYKLISDSVSNSGKVTNQPAAEAGYTARKQRDIKALTKLITKERSSELQVLSVWVPGGDLAGAASIIKDAFDNTHCWGYFNWRARVKLVRPFNLAEFIKSLLDSAQDLHLHTRQELQRSILPGDEDELLEEFNKRVNKNPYLIVLEDVSTTEEEWDIIRKCFLPHNNNGSRIFVTTQHLRIARLCTGSPCFQRFSWDQSHCVFFKEGPLIGRMSEVYQLRRCLAIARFNGWPVISVWGIPGVGKSALVRNLLSWYLEARVYRRYIWVDVSNPFNLQDFCRSLLLQLRSDSLKANEDPVIECNEDPVTECQDLLLAHRCPLVVVDNLRSTYDWDLIDEALAFRTSGSLIIVITNEERTALHCADEKDDLVFNVKALDAREAIDLFKRQVDRNIQMQPFLKQLISKCGGLPAVIVAVANFLAREFGWMGKARKFNHQFINQLETRSDFACLRDLFGWIHSYVRSGPDLLKPCILYLSIFLQSQIIRRRRLVMRWVAEGYPKDKTSDSAEELFAKITELSLIQPAEQTIITNNIRMVRCQINPFFQEYIISRTNEENRSFAPEVCALKEGCSRQTTTRTARHIVIEKSWKRDRIMFKRILSENLADGTSSLCHLRSLTVFGEWKSYFVSEDMKVLRVLDLENAYGIRDKDLKKMLELLPRLKFLSLRGCRDIRNLPPSVGDLRQLQTLDLRDTYIVTMPAFITRLKKLQYLRAGTMVPAEDPSPPHAIAFKVSKLRRFLKPVGVEVTSGVGKLTMLHTLGVVNVGSARGKDILKEIKNLTQLRKLGVFGVDKKNNKKFCSAISGHSNLQSLSVWYNKDNCCWDGMTSEITQETTKPPKELQSLKLYRLANKLPVWFNEGLSNLRKMNLEIDMLSAENMGVIGLLPELLILRLRVNKPPTTGGMLNFHLMYEEREERSFKKVKILEIAFGSGSLDVAFGKNAMESLEVLKVGCCMGSVLQFTELKRLTKLVEVYVIGSHDDTLKRHLEEKLNGHECNPRLENVDLSTVASAEGSETQESTGGNDRSARYSFPF